MPTTPISASASLICASLIARVMHSTIFMLLSPRASLTAWVQGRERVGGESTTALHSSNLRRRHETVAAATLFLQPGHQTAQLAAHLLDGMLRRSAAQGLEAGLVGLVFQDPLAS